MTQVIVTQGAPEINQEFLSMAEAANKLGITAGELRRWIKKSEVSSPGIFKQRHLCTVSGINQRMLTIHKDVLSMVSKYKGFPTNNQHERKSAAHVLQNPQSVVPVPIQEQLNMLMDYVNEQKALEPPVNLTNGQREFLVERVRYYAIQTGITPKWLHIKLNKYVNRKSIDDYKFSDYKLAAKYLKEMYQASHLNWE